MIVTYNWLKEFVDFDLTPEELADLLTMLGLEVEGMQTLGSGMDDVVVAVVEEKRQHPNADKLSLCKVNSGSEILDIVCGAQNFSSGDTVALAKIGAVLPGNFKIKRSKIRGEESSGMLCSEKELGLAEESPGIMILQSGLPLGQPVFEALRLKDTQYEIGLTPNRADCLSVIGVAREIAAKLGKPMICPTFCPPETGEKAADVISVTLDNPEGCPRYSARYISGCRIAASPEWLVRLLNAVGVRSINNVVDITNLVMMELGQPLHAFDCDRLAGRRIVVRRAFEGEPFTTLDSKKRSLTANDLVICDGEGPVALAGIMGGENSEISSETTNVLLESAFFKPAVIRATSKRLGLRTESSHRFERGIDIEGTLRALDRASSLMAELAGGKIAQGITDAYPGKREPQVITLQPSKANALIGVELSATEMMTLLSNLGFSVKEAPCGNLEVIVPSYRVDIDREVDLIEEIARLNGFDKIPATIRNFGTGGESATPRQKLERAARSFLASLGMNEIINYSFSSPEAADKLTLEESDPRRFAIKLANPLVEEHSVMRTTLLPNILEAVAHNLSFRSLDLKLFEIRRIYIPQTGDDMPYEPLCIAGALTGAREPLGWCHAAGLVDFFDAKGIVESLLEHLRITGAKWIADASEPYYHPGKSCGIFIGRDRIGSAGEIHPAVQENFALEKLVYTFELDFEKLIKYSRNQLSVFALSRYPDSSRDIAMLALEQTTAEQILECVKSVRAPEIEEANIFDVYRGDAIPEGHKSVAIRIRYRSFEKTLLDDEIEAIHGKIIATLVNKLNVSIR